MSVKILASADLHLGRRPSRLPESLRSSSRELGPAGVWSKMVDAALEAEVDVVVLAGDVVEHENDFYEAYRELYQGVQRLSAGGIKVYAVVGNHDVHVLPRLAGQIENIELLGRAGEWESVTLQVKSERVTFWGWSFPRPQVTYSPLAGQRLERGAGPNIGVLHCDRGQSSSPYAPVSEAELAAAGVDCWLLGHTHAADDCNYNYKSAYPGDGVGGYLGGYLGSPVGTDPGEPGAHGPWLITIEGGQIGRIEQWPLAALRWEELRVDLSAITAAEQARERVLEAARDLDQQLQNAPPQAVGLRVVLGGQSDLGSEAVALFGDEARDHLLNGAAGTHYFIERVQLATRPSIDLAELAADSDPPGLLARQLLLLERPLDDPQRQQLIAEARRRLQERAREARWQEISPATIDDEQAAEWLRQAGLRILERLRAQQPQEEAEQ
ncbi:metallophosphoesterase family protein [Halorhodospira halochloris]|uniref:metallophosphoesterase family protein n=1 Tax=Halorhodospira halochloris TaxID=1052 RepID=UPI001EE7F0C3|nr:DNA repair exonuclease [Halorhodospira halochloris]MCG5548333.1 DNA repair exonuclease [Halorhodospira halochloris]